MLMRKCRWMPMAALVAVCFALPMPSWALGLGEIEVESALNERFVGSIELLDVEGFQSSELMVSLASREDFDRVGVERFFYLTNLKFEVDISTSPAIVKVSSAQPVSEPYLNFIVEVLWPRGRLLKEFTVLLDPPTFSQAAAPAVAAPSQAAPAVRPQRTESTSADSGTRVTLAPTSRPTQTAPRQLPGAADGITTTRDDTLWKIAQRTLPSDRVTVNQQMLAIQRKNPNAFIRNNINLLKAGYVLDIPTESEALQVDSAAANSDVAAQTQDWRSGSTTQVAANDRATSQQDDGGAPALRSQVDATGQTSNRTAGASQGQGEVRILANSGDVASGTAAGDDASVNQLIEEKESLARQVDELTYQLDREKDIAANQVTVKDRQLEVKDAELAQLQQQMKDMREQLAQAQQNQDQSPKAAPQETPWWMSPMVLFGVIGVLVLILVYLLIAARRSRNAYEESYETEYDDEYNPQSGDDNQAAYAAAGATAVAGAATAAVVAAQDEEDVSEALADLDELEALEDAANREPYIGEATSDDEDLDVDELDDQVDGDTAAPSGQAPSSSQTGDVIGEAEIYIAYGRYGQAANLLSGVLSNEPERWDVRLKLLEVYVESHDEESFATHAQYIVDHCDDEEVLLACRELEAQFDSSHLDISQGDENAPTATERDSQETDADTDAEDFALELDDLEVETAGEADEATSATADASDDLEFELEFDTDLDTDADSAEQPEDAPSAVTQGSDELGGDLGLDFDPDKDIEEPEALEDIEFESGSAEAAEETLSEADDLDELIADVDSADAGAAEQAEHTEQEELAEDDDFEFDASDDTDINTTKLDLAEAYIDMGDADGAQEILREVLEEGSPEQQTKAQSLLDSIPG